MRQPIHHSYDQLTEHERNWVDDVFAEIMAMDVGTREGARPPLTGNDVIERAVDALARAVIESRREA